MRQTASMMATIGDPGPRGATCRRRVGGGLKFAPLFVASLSVQDDSSTSPYLFGNVLGQFTRRLFAWMCEEGFVDEATRDKDWVAYVQLLLTGAEPVPEFLRAMRAIEQFTLSHTKAELLQGTFDRHVLVVPVSTMADVAIAQLESRGYWQRLVIRSPTTGVPGPFKVFRPPIEYRRCRRLNNTRNNRRDERRPPPQANVPAAARAEVCDFRGVVAPAAPRPRRRGATV
jgi:hypothetical protein